jgi:hypothetical protein
MMLMNFNAVANVLIPDSFRQGAFDYIYGLGSSGALYV